MDTNEFKNALERYNMRYSEFLKLVKMNEELNWQEKNDLLRKSYGKPEEIIPVLKKSERYKDFTFLNQAEKFSDHFHDKDFKTVQVYDMTPISMDKEIVGFAGVFRWVGNKITPLDGDSYSDPTIWGYKTFMDSDQVYLDILAEDW